MRSIIYILLVSVIMLSACGRRGANTQNKIVDIDSGFYSPKLIEKNITSVDLKLSKHSAHSVFYITPAKHDFYSYESLVASILIDTAVNESNAKKLWQFMSDYTSHSRPVMHGRLPHNPLLLVNSFQSGLCDDRNAALAKLFLLAGYNSRVYHLGGHVVAEVYYDNSWHMFDADWGLYCLNDSNRIADVEYISKHPGVIKLGNDYNALIRNYIGPAILKYVYTSTENNMVNTWYNDSVAQYKNNLVLREGDELQLHVERLGWEGELRNLFVNHATTNTRHWGSLKRRVKVNAFADYVYHEDSPYAIDKIAVSANSKSTAVWVYYSVDGDTWQLKGMLGDGNTNLTFKPLNAEGEGKVFSYRLKFEAVSQPLVEEAYTIENSILFSEKILLNQDGGFRILPIRCARNLQVELQVSSH